MSVLTKTDEFGFFGIRLESIGGLGAHVAGQMLAQAGILYQGLNGANFSSYGSEKKGSPVKAYVRFCNPDVQVRNSAPIEEPHVIGIFHERLIGREPVTLGARPDSIILVNTTKSPDEIRELLQLESGTIATVDAMKIAVEEKTRVNTAMLGAICRAVDFLEPEKVREVISDTFMKRYPHTVPGNLRTFDRGYAEVEMKTFEPAPGTEVHHFKRPGPLFGYKNAPIGGVIVNAGNTVLKDLSASRSGFLPAFDVEKCINCGQCDQVCPDFCFVWEKDVDQRGREQMFLRGVDYQYCKGCLKCVEICPTQSLTSLRETDGYAEAHGVKKYAVL